MWKYSDRNQNNGCLLGWEGDWMERGKREYSRFMLVTWGNTFVKTQLYTYKKYISLQVNISSVIKNLLHLTSYFLYFPNGTSLPRRILHGHSKIMWKPAVWCRTFQLWKKNFMLLFLSKQESDTQKILRDFTYSANEKATLGIYADADWFIILVPSWDYLAEEIRIQFWHMAVIDFWGEIYFSFEERRLSH